MQRDKEIEDCFNLFDFPKRNRVHSSKLKEMLSFLGIPLNKEMEAMWIEKFKGHNNEIELKDFRNCIKNTPQINPSANDLKDAFELLDRDEDGFISRNDLKLSSRLLLDLPLDDKKIEEMFKSFSTVDDKISLESFIKLLS